MDLVAMTEGLQPAADWLRANWPVVALVIGVYVLMRSSRGFFGRMLALLEKTALANWQLALLGATGIVLSIASGWTTWDGMRNFTNEPVLSLLITFGIQGVMLIVAWLIGESFASGMNVNRDGAGRRDGGFGLEWFAGAALGVFIIAGGIFILANGFNERTEPLLSGEQIMFALVAVAVVALIAILQGDLLAPYLQSVRIMLRNAVLWVMFLACMATSVFFSFDSLFSTIFPQEERARAAELRAQNQVAGIVSDIGQTIATRRLQEAEALFSSPGWLAYDNELRQLATAAQTSQSAIEAFFVSRMEERRRAIAQQEERKASAKSQQAGLQAKSIQLNEEISRLQAERPEAAAAVDQQRQVVLEVQRRLDEQKTRTLAEEKGVEGTGKVGRGKQWRAEKAAESKVAAELQVANERLNAPRRRLEKIDQRIASIKSELFQIEGQLAQLKGEADTAAQRIKAAEQTIGLEESELKVDPSRVLPAFERSRVAFRQDPTLPRLNDLRQQCTQLLDAMMATPTTKERVRSIDCDPKQASEAAAIVFALNSGTQIFLERCAGGERLEGLGSTDALFGFARKCLADSGLPSKDTDALRTKINLAELNRDDKAHRFVVTWNAFTDGNRLAYLALAIAIAIDALVFMSGLFGANAVRSPLQDVPRRQPRSAAQLESVIEAALQPHAYETAHAAIEAMHPISTEDGFTQEVILTKKLTADRNAVAKVLNAGATIGAVSRDPRTPDRYLIRPELFEFLSICARRQYETNKEHRRLAELKRLLTVALQPHVGDHTAIVLHNMHPINEHDGYTSEVLLNEVETSEVPVVRRTLNAASVLSYVARDTRSGEEDRFYVHKDLYKTLAMIAAVNPPTGTWRTTPRITGNDGGIPQIPASAGGDLTPPQKHVAAPKTALLQDRSLDARQDDAPVHNPNRSRPATGQDGNENARWRRHFEHRLLSALDFNYPDKVMDRLNAPGVRETALDAWKALDDYCETNENARRELASSKDEFEAKYSEEYSNLRSETAGDPAAGDILYSTEVKLTEDLPVLILFPEIGLVPHLINELERAAEQQPEPAPAEALLLRRLKDADTMIQEADLADPIAWRRIRDTLSGLGNDEDEPSRRNDSGSA